MLPFHSPQLSLPDCQETFKAAEGDFIVGCYIVHVIGKYFFPVLCALPLEIAVPLVRKISGEPFSPVAFFVVNINIISIPLMKYLMAKRSLNNKWQPDNL